MNTNIEQLLLDNEKLILHACSKFMKAKNIIGTGYTFEDLKSEATLSFIEHYSKYDESKHVKFSAFIYYHMYHHLQKTIDRKGNLIKFSYQTVAIANLIKRKELSQDGELKLSISELSNKYSYSKNAIKKAIKYLEICNTESLNITIDDEEQTQKIDMIHSYDDNSLFYIREINLNERQEKIVKLLSQSYTYSDIARELNVSREYIRQCANKIKVKLERYYQNA